MKITDPIAHGLKRTNETQAQQKHMLS